MENNINSGIVDIERAQEEQKAQDVQKEIKGVSHTEFMAGVLENIGKVAPRAQSEPAVTAREILDRIDRIIAQGEELKKVVEQIRDLPINEEQGLDGGYRAQAIGEIYSAREATNQKQIKLLSRMYDDIPRKARETNPLEVKKDILGLVHNMDFVGVSAETAKNVLDFYQHQLDNL